MIQKETIENIIKNYLLENKLFLVDISVSRDNDVEITVDSYNGVTIDNCSEISNLVHQGADPEEDFSLTVGSAGLSQPFKVIEQYHKFKGSEIEIILKSGSKLKTLLCEVSTSGIEVEFEKTIKEEGKKKKIKIKTKEFIDFESIKSAKPIINFR